MGRNMPLVSIDCLIADTSPMRGFMLWLLSVSIGRVADVPMLALLFIVLYVMQLAAVVGHGHE